MSEQVVPDKKIFDSIFLKMRKTTRNPVKRNTFYFCFSLFFVDT